MSKFDYERSREMVMEPFYALLMAAMHNAPDTDSAQKLREAFPEVGAELSARYNAPRGLLPGERDEAGYRRDEDGALITPSGEVFPAGAW